MISLMPRQRELHDFLVRHMSLGGGRPTLDQVRVAMGLRHKSGAWQIWKALDARLSDADRAAMVPRDPEGVALRFIPLAALGLPE